jgi:hypothetical protein
MSSYQPGIPTGFINLDTDYQNIQNNFDTIDETNSLQEGASIQVVHLNKINLTEFDYEDEIENIERFDIVGYPKFTHFLQNNCAKF